MSLLKFSPTESASSSNHDDFSNLTRVPFVALCEFLSFSQLLACAQVNRHWRKEIHTYLNNQMHSLVLIMSNVDRYVSYPSGLYLPSQPYYSDHLTTDDGSPMFPRPEYKCPHRQLICLRFSSSLAIKLTQLCTRLHEFVCAYTYLDDDSLDATIDLLKTSEELRSLNLYIKKFGFSLERKSEQLKKLFAAINQLTQLKQLSLEFHEPLDMEPDLSALGRVWQFQFYSADEDDILYPSLIAYAPENVHLTNIVYITEILNRQLHTDIRRYLDNERGQAVARNFSVLFTHRIKLTYFSRPVLAGMLVALVSHFTSLSCLQIEVKIADWHDSMRHLTSLTNLIDLYLCNNEKHVEEIPLDEEMEFVSDQTLGPLLPSVRSLHFINFVTDHRNLKKFYLSYYFPQLQVLEIIWKHFWELNYCGACGPCHRELNPDAIDKSLNREIFSDDRHREARAVCASGALADWNEKVFYKRILKNVYFYRRAVDLSHFF